MILFLAHTDAVACSLSPTAKISFPDNQSVHYVGDNIVFDGTTSTANQSVDGQACGSINEYCWRLNGSTISWNSAFIHNFTLGDGQSEQVHSIELRVRNTAGKYNTKTIQITITRNNKSLYYLTDHLGSVRVTVNEQGDPVGWDDYYPFGLAEPVPKTFGMPGRTQNASNPNDDQKFTGYLLEQQGDLGIYHAEARMYDPVIGRFMSVDRRAEKYPESSPYVYVTNNPINFTDMSGDTLDPQGSKQFLAEVYDAIIYLEKAGVAGVLQDIHNSPITIRITEGTGLNDFYYDPENKEIVFNPFSALETVDGNGNPTGNSQTPALGLLHEGGHAKNDIEGTTDLTPRTDGFTNNEEFNVIMNVENPAALILGEPTRNNHFGIPFRTTCSTCTNRAPAPKTPSLIDRFFEFFTGGN